MNILDVVALFIIGLSALTAFFKGLVGELFRIGSVVAGFLAAAHFYSGVAYQLLEAGVDPIPAGLLAFVGIFVAVLILGAVAAGFSNRILKTLKLKWIDRLLGATFGLLRGALIITILFLAFASFPVRRDLLEASRLAPFFLTLGKGLVQVAPANLESLFQDGYDRLYRIWLERDLSDEGKA